MIDEEVRLYNTNAERGRYNRQKGDKSFQSARKLAPLLSCLATSCDYCDIELASVTGLRVYSLVLVWWARLNAD